MVAKKKPDYKTALLRAIKNNYFFFGLLFVMIFAFFKNALTMNFILDDFFFLRISHAKSFHDFINLFSPFRDYSYKPLATEVYYFFIRILKFNLLVGHLIAFITFFIGLYYLYKCLKTISKNDFFSKLATALYALHFTHVFQLYYFGTFQEVAIFTFLAISFYLFLNNKYFRSLLFYVFALLSKETAILFLPFLVFFAILKQRNILKKTALSLIPYTLISGIFYLLYKISLSHVTALENYQLRLSPRLIINNFLWYFLWSVGLPNFMPLYVTSVLKPPIAEFWNLFRIPDITPYFIFLISYWFVFLLAIVALVVRKKQKLKDIFFYFIITATGFSIFILPLLLFMHKWMVRLTLPLVFITTFEAFIIYQFFSKGKMFKILGIVLIILYMAFNYYGVRVHEPSSTFFLETRFIDSADQYFAKHKNGIVKHRYLVFIDNPNGPTAWGGSKKLKVSFHDQDFLDYYFPEVHLTALYGFENKQIPRDSFVVASVDILTGGK